jgi:large subunit ribosomal protein L35
MPKVKTNKTAAKRFKISGTGKILHGHARMNHLKVNKRKGRLRRLTVEGEVTGGTRDRIRRMLPNSF